MAHQKAKKAKHTSRHSESREIHEYSRKQQEALQRVIKARKDAEQALEQAIAKSSGGKRMRAEGEQLAEVLAAAYKKLRDGKLSRRQIEHEHGPAVKAFEKKYRAVSEGAWLEVADMAPTAYQTYDKLLRKKPPVSLHVEFLYFLGMIFRHPQTNDGDETSSTQQALLQPLDVSATSFTLKITQDHTDAAGGIGSIPSFANPAAGSFVENPGAPTFDYVPGVASARAMVGADFTFPTGYTSFAISADIDWNYNLSTWVVFGGAGCGADLQLRVEPAGGANPTEKLQGLASVVAPVLWGATATGSGSSTIALTLNLDGQAARELKVYAGASSHAEAEGVAGISMANVMGTVTRISIHAE